MSNDIEHRSFWGCQGMGGIKSISFNCNGTVVEFQIDPNKPIDPKKAYPHTISYSVPINFDDQIYNKEHILNPKNYTFIDRNLIQ